MKKALVTGAAGFVGSHLIEYLLTRSINVTAVVHPKHSTANLDKIIDKITSVSADLTKKTEYKSFLKEDFDYIFHLAAFSSPTESFKRPQETLKNNIFSQLYLLQALTKTKSKSKILIVGSSDEYGEVDKKGLSVDEKADLKPASPYAVSKVAQDMLGYQFFINYGLRVVRLRPFNHIGPRQSKQFVVPSFASQIASIEAEGKGGIKVGNLDTYRDFTDVRDIVRGYLLALEKGKIGEVYNIGSGRVYKIADILKRLISLSKVKINVIKDKSLVRKTDVQKIYCDYSKFKRDTGWEPKIPIAKTLFDTIEYERSKIKN